MTHTPQATPEKLLPAAAGATNNGLGATAGIVSASECAGERQELGGGHQAVADLVFGASAINDVAGPAQGQDRGVQPVIFAARCDRPAMTDPRRRVEGQVQLIGFGLGYGHRSDPF